MAFGVKKVKVNQLKGAVQLLSETIAPYIKREILSELLIEVGL